MIKFYNEYKRRKARGDRVRPIWQILLYIPIALLYLPAKAFVDFCDDNL
jgi:hypothetical protein